MSNEYLINLVQKVDNFKESCIMLFNSKTQEEFTANLRNYNSKWQELVGLKIYKEYLEKFEDSPEWKSILADIEQYKNLQQ